MDSWCPLGHCHVLQVQWNKISSAEQCSSVQFSAVPFSVLHCSALNCNTVQSNLLQYIAVWYSPENWTDISPLRTEAASKRCFLAQLEKFLFIFWESFFLLLKELNYVIKATKKSEQGNQNTGIQGTKWAQSFQKGVSIPQTYIRISNRFSKV